MYRLDRSKNGESPGNVNFSAYNETVLNISYILLFREINTSLRIYQVMKMKSSIDAYGLTTVRVNEMFASCLQHKRPACNFKNL